MSYKRFFVGGLCFTDNGFIVHLFRKTGLKFGSTFGVLYLSCVTICRKVFFSVFKTQLIQLATLKIQLLLRLRVNYSFHEYIRHVFHCLGKTERVFEFPVAWLTNVNQTKENVQHGNIRAHGHGTFEKSELHAAPHAFLYESRHIVVLVNNTHFDGEALAVHWCSEGHLQCIHKHSL